MNGLVRVYLLDNMHVVRLVNGNGVTVDVPISGISAIKKNASAPVQSLMANGKRFTFKLGSDVFINPAIMFAIT